jgi:hypothetical protein
MKKIINGIENISELNISNDIKIISLSDIHGDIQSLIIALRDCGNVIKKKIVNFDNNKYDEDLENLLLLDISSNENNYKDDLNYEWCGCDTHIAIVGDFLDARRDYNDININKKIILSQNGEFKIIEEKLYGINEYPQIEIKLFKFLNSINKQAMRVGGRIIKMFGNHEIYNILSDNYHDFIEKYNYKETVTATNYYKNQNRFDSFNIGGEGYKLLIEDGMYILFKINNNLFIHGELINEHNEDSFLKNMTFEDYNYINYVINFDSNLLYNSNIKFKQNIIINNLINIYKMIGLDSNGPLWKRTFGNYNNIEERFTNNKDFCNNVKSIFTILKDNNLFDDNVDDLRIIIGHCPQSFSTHYDKPNITFSHIVKQNDIIEILGPQLEIVNNKSVIPDKLILKDEHYKKYQELSILKLLETSDDLYSNESNDKPFILNNSNDDKPFILNNSNDDSLQYDIKYRGRADLEKKIVFGISMECDKDNDSSDSYIYKVDVSSSRGFDNLSSLKKSMTSEENKTKYLLSRTPQILQILNNKTNIIRSKLENTLIHQPRQF